MFDIYRLFYFIEETGLLIQEKWYKVTHPEVWDCNQRNSKEIEECSYEDEDILEDESMASSLGHMGYMEGSEGLFVNSMDAEVGQGIKEETKVPEPDD